MKRGFHGAVLLGSFALSAAAQQPMLLHDGQHVTLHGTLAMRPAGRLQFVAVATADPYFAAGVNRRQTPIGAVGLSGYHRYDLLYAHRGQAVTVRGTVITSDASPYYLHGVLLRAVSIQLANGTDLIGTPRAPRPIAVDAGLYRASVVLGADLAQPWQYSAHGRPDPEQQFLSCSSNGGGDVVNCACAHGFHAIHA